MPEQPVRLRLIGYWAGPDTTGSWPSPSTSSITVGPGRPGLHRDLPHRGPRGLGLHGLLPLPLLRQGQRRPGALRRNLPVAERSGPLPHRARRPAPRRVRAARRSADGEPGAGRAGRRVVGRRTPPPRSALASGASSGATSLDLQARTVFPSARAAVGCAEGPRGPSCRARSHRGAAARARGRSEEEWGNDTLARFLDAFGELLGAIENSYVNTGRAVPADPWVLVADAFGGPGLRVTAPEPVRGEEQTLARTSP